MERSRALKADDLAPLNHFKLVGHGKFPGEDVLHIKEIAEGGPPVD